MATFRTHVFGRIEDTSFTLEPVSATVGYKLMQGRSRHHIVDEYPSWYCNVVLDQTFGQFIAFQDWYANELDRGEKWFTAFLPLGGLGGYATCNCHFAAPFRAEVLGDLRYKVTARWEVRPT